MLHKRIYFVTGKGGVGKTTLALALAKQLQKSNRKVFYTSNDQKQNSYLCEQLNIPFILLGPLDSIEKYIAKKLNSQIIASWITRAPFVRAIFQMLPGLESIVIIGELIDLLKRDPEITIVFDMPSSGHTTTLFESIINFKEIFSPGVLASDLSEIWNFISNRTISDILISTIPTTMGLHEAIELKQSLLSLCSNFNVNIILNLALAPSLQKHDDNLPPFLIEKIRLEKEVAQENIAAITTQIPFVFSSSTLDIIQEIADKIELAKDHNGECQ
ncbi:MAG: hypothetical protein A2504_13225 [Bdellovibrionales bacterium RIFOXYD12_FULL_39_22]|nr:MAG: hypothetical protein A2385_01025 [Bdellovibrionales bacterium RIFOXYB1_FULL_39_21]OFZ43589.1 MAG: hypothetical protein A2485_12695 [Bdellovibrionales bacterium RIFOXYC12_FULL_39_17]OFZ44608.1 MAG: hypothetical protein A2404_10385 [Bdellovibrionales bacterium RIFOXYC1_FULL_39_130]OFZ76367.1 MAG: hypothetical protein A2560_07005 [Bdellovibrionales bacterium RIFOXYD1_FULL_39_84]OFZ94633.1 MAG: hypothetical protein A2504_13225 [Bdellovibrionales bacterium RIFOXYD12_FULL_39_22]HLE12911.1 Ar